MRRAFNGSRCNTALATLGFILATLGFTLATMPGIGFAQEASAPVVAAPAVPAPPAISTSPAADAPATAAPAVPAAAAPVAGAGLLPPDFSAWGMFMHADVIVKAVMVGLIFASIITWTIWLAKSMELFAAGRRIREAFGIIDGARSLAIAIDRIGTENHVARTLLHAASEERRQSVDALEDREGLKERIVSHLDRIEAGAGRRITKGTGVLATIGATAPFVGLFGTVWGIMNSFIGISQSHTTNLAVVAPGIAEALLATACGLFAAIPAVVIYNHFARQVAAYKAVVGDTAAAVLRLVSRDLSRGEDTITERAGPRESLMTAEVD
ncbi:MAG TPA: tonB-system energizer ExbB [Stellaceae bacterium]|jgi:biopolymer transport protein ExbB|nr:tonB-system energizer ExbB [Stellaceae bacterium]